MEIKIPSVGESITEVIVGDWAKSDGDYVTQDELLCELESEKTNFELRAEASGVLHITASAGSTVEVGAVIGRIDTEAPQPSSTASTAQSSAAVASSSASGSGKETTSVEAKTAPAAKKDLIEKADHPAKGHPSPAAAKHLAEHGISPDSVSGSGVDGRITKEDAVQASAPSQSPKADRETPAPIDKHADKGASHRPNEARAQKREKLSSLRRTLARRLVAVKNETAMLTTFNEVNMRPIMRLRKQYKDAFKEKYDVGLGFMSFFVRAVCVALREWPAVNAYIEEQEAVYHEYCDISIAVSTPKGLVVPVVRHAQSLGFDDIEKEIARLAQKAREGQLSIDDMKGGTFTITNGGVFGSLLSTPILNAPQSAILGMHNIVERPVAIKGEISIQPMMYLALSYDHRMIDGRESVSFLVRVKELLEDPGRLLLGV